MIGLADENRATDIQLNKYQDFIQDKYLAWRDELPAQDRPKRKNYFTNLSNPLGRKILRTFFDKMIELAEAEQLAQN